MAGLIFKKVILLIPSFIGITLAAFIFIRLLPGDPVMLLSGERGIEPERHAKLMSEFGFDRPFYEQYADYVVGLFKGDFGNSVVTRQSVLSEFIVLFPATLELSLFAIITAIVIGIPVGIFCAVKKGSWTDNSLMTVALFGYSMPIFWWGLLMIILFSGILGWTPVSGRISLVYFFEPVTGFMLIDAWLSGEEGAFLSALHHMILPALVLSTIPLAVIVRQTRSAVIEVLEEDYIRTAYSKGLSFFRILFIHALRNAMIPIITTIGLQVGVLLAGAILTETIFSWPGIGHWMVHSIYRRDYPSVQGGLVLIAGIVTAVNLVVDLTYIWINPRIQGCHSRDFNFMSGCPVRFALFPSFFAPYGAAEQFRDATLSPPAWQEGGDARYLLGTDPLGRDILSRIIYGAQYSTFIGIVVVGLSLLSGIFFGMLAGFFGGTADFIIMRVMDVILAFPSLLLALVMVAVLGPGLTNAMIAIAVVQLPHFVRLTRAQAMAEKKKDYFTAARIIGTSRLKLMFTVLLPNCLSPLIVQATLNFSSAVLDAAALGFLGLGAQPPTPEWGTLLAESREFILRAWWVVTFPGLAILITVLSINLIGDSLRDSFDPRLKKS
ncbi:hypothetical protein CHS0354_002054 [Potamilus streckersoni]|uniref:ABC transmembrane type-1 domain-containing protein n=1 Tax=Potamilus streckersoni TaxID=2493646 RepID=A0AAE0W7E5_9BIVA|nr:hypothetical protein CHS0354_002054 [Potamilus streckersoni]